MAIARSSKSPAEFLPIERHGVIGDRRTGALVAADGTINWFCAPDFDGPPIFGALLDPACGGFCQFAPRVDTLGRQSYLAETAVLTTTWSDPSGAGDIELADVMAWPANERPPVVSGQRVIIRRLRSPRQAEVRFELYPRRNFKTAPGGPRTVADGVVFPFDDGHVGVWSTFPLEVKTSGVSADFTMRAGDEHWAVLGWNVEPGQWSAGSAAEMFASAADYWRDWSADLKVTHPGERAPALRRSAITVQLLSHAKYESAVAALTSSLPERVGGDRNYDYRYAWVRDASLSLAILARMGKTHEVQCYLNWLCGLSSSTSAPLQVCYRLSGDPHLDQDELANVRGYLDSQPVRVGNRAAKQTQLGSMGFFADCARIYVDQGGEWQDEFWQLLKRAADFTCKHWQEKDSGVWELPEKAHYVSSRVMSWVVLARAVYIAEKTGHAGETDHWREAAAAIHAEVMDKGWCSQKNSFRQRYGSDALDASALLIPLMEFLPPTHSRVGGTLMAVERELVVHGLVHRFDPSDTMGGKQLPIGEFEGAFLPCVFWHAHALAKIGRCDQAEAILARCEAVAGELGIFAEEIDARHDTFLGNTPLLFSHVEYARAVTALHEARDNAAPFATQTPP